MRILRLGLFVCALIFVLSVHLALVLQAAAEPSATETERRQAGTPKSAAHPHVVCVWQLLLNIKAVGDRCFRDDTTEFPKLLNEAIERVDAFIIENAPATNAELEAGKARMLRVSEQICRPDSKNVLLQTYEQRRDWANGDIVMFRYWIAKLVAVPRKVVIDPCF